MEVQFEVLFDVIAGVSCIGAILMAWWGYRTWDVARQERRAEFVLKLLEKLRENSSVQQVVLAIDHDRGVDELDEEVKDRTLSYMSYICYLKKTGVVSDAEFSFFEYEVTRALGNQHIKEYLEFVRKIAKGSKCRSPFVALDEYDKECRK